jgi:hypothetical protein
MVDRGDRRSLSRRAMGGLSRHYARSARLPTGDVGTGNQLDLHPERVVLGDGDFQDERVTDGVVCSLADALGKAVEEAGEEALKRRL